MSRAVEHLREIITRLRSPGGCPWDREQTAESLRPSLVEEAYEVVDAIDRRHASDLEEELGDLLINILMQAQIASEEKVFTFDTIASVAAEKLIRRHPHVFADATADSSAEVLKRWDEIKREEFDAKIAKGSAEGSGKEAVPSLLDGMARAFPALVHAQKIQKKAAKTGFDWERPEDVLEKIREELVEVEQEMAGRKASGGPARLNEEIGDLLFAVVNLARALSIDSESSLRAATAKFERRFRSMEQGIPDGKAFGDHSPIEMNELWERVKETEKS